MFVKPSNAFVGKPSVVASSSGSAKYARYARLFPSTRKSSESRAGASSRSSSTPVRVFGLTGTTLSSGADEHHGPAWGQQLLGPARLPRRKRRSRGDSRGLRPGVGGLAA